MTSNPPDDTLASLQREHEIHRTGLAALLGKPAGDRTLGHLISDIEFAMDRLRAERDEARSAAMREASSHASTVRRVFEGEFGDGQVFNVSPTGDPRYRYTAGELFCARAGHPFSLAFDGQEHKGTAILTDDNRVVMLAENGAVGVVPMTPEGAARMREHLAALPGAVEVRVPSPDSPGAGVYITRPGRAEQDNLARAEVAGYAADVVARLRGGFPREVLSPGGQALLDEAMGLIEKLAAIDIGVGDTARFAADSPTPPATPRFISGNSEPAELGREFARGQRFDPLELEPTVHQALAVIYDNEGIGHEVGKIYVYDGAAVIHIVEPQAVRFLQAGAVELSRDREFAGNPYQPFIDGDGNPVSVLAELEAIATWEGSTERLEGLVARLAKAVMYSHRLLERTIGRVAGDTARLFVKHTAARPGERDDASHEDAQIESVENRELRLLAGAVNRILQREGVDIGETRSAALECREPARLYRLLIELADARGAFDQRAVALPNIGPEPLDGVCLVMRVPLDGQDYPSVMAYFEGLFTAADAASARAPAGSRMVLVLPHEVHELATDTLWPADGREMPLLEYLTRPGCFSQLEIRKSPPPSPSTSAGGIPTWSALRNRSERLRERMRRALEALYGSPTAEAIGKAAGILREGLTDGDVPPDGAERRGDVPGAFEELVRQAGGAGYLTHLDPKLLERRPRDLLAEALKFGSEAARDLAALRSRRPESSRMQVMFGTGMYNLPTDIASNYLRADVGSVDRIAALLEGLDGVSDRVAELEQGTNAAATELEAVAESDSIDDRSAACAAAARLLRRAL